MQCPKCQFENREGANLCNECGYKFELACPECAASNRVGRKFCDACGNDLRTSQAAFSIDYSSPQSYTPKFLADKILNTRSSLEGERKLVTVLFADVANYTAMSEKLDPEEVHRIMDGCFKILMNEIHRHKALSISFPVMVSWPCLEPPWLMRIMPSEPAIRPFPFKKSSKIMERR